MYDISNKADIDVLVFMIKFNGKEVGGDNRRNERMLSRAMATTGG